MFDFESAFQSALDYSAFLDQYASPEQRRRWDEFHASVSLTADQTALLQSFTREMHVLVLAGAWCGDCVNQCPIFEHFAAAAPAVRVRYMDRDADAALAEEMKICGGNRVPSLIFLSEDGHYCGQSGDRTLSKYRSLVRNLAGPACPTGLAAPSDLTAAVVQDWLNEFERMQWMLRTSGRLRQLHGD